MAISLLSRNHAANAVAVARAIDVDRRECRRHAVRCDWQAIADRMRESLMPVSGTGGRAKRAHCTGEAA
ncbi:MAG: hypothetical protein J4F45_02520 [Pseudomonadales bacterium]|nr:hypothetical protein [Pseudomonadales bacterium]